MSDYHLRDALQFDFGSMSYSSAGTVYTYGGDWGEMTLSIVHHVELSRRVRDALVKPLENALVEDFKRNPQGATGAQC